MPTHRQPEAVVAAAVTPSEMSLCNQRLEG
jgi:hypothetical protein